MPCQHRLETTVRLEVHVSKEDIVWVPLSRQQHPRESPAFPPALDKIQMGNRAPAEPRGYWDLQGKQLQVLELIFPLSPHPAPHPTQKQGAQGRKQSELYGQIQGEGSSRRRSARAEGRVLWAQAVPTGEARLMAPIHWQTHQLPCGPLLNAQLQSPIWLGPGEGVCFGYPAEGETGPAGLGRHFSIS